MELKVWIGSVQRVISGVSDKTTSQEVILALAQATATTGRFTLVEKWRDYEKTLTPSDCPLVSIQKFGNYAHEVQFILQQTGEVASKNRRLAEAKSPKPQRKRGGIKKSFSFSGGPQSNSNSKLSHTQESITEEGVHDHSLSPQPPATSTHSEYDRHDLTKTDLSNKKSFRPIREIRDCPIRESRDQSITSQIQTGSHSNIGIPHSHHVTSVSARRLEPPHNTIHHEQHINPELHSGTHIHGTEKKQPNRYTNNEENLDDYQAFYHDSKGRQHVGGQSKVAKDSDSKHRHKLSKEPTIPPNTHQPSSTREDDSNSRQRHHLSKHELPTHKTREKRHRKTSGSATTDSIPRTDLPPHHPSTNHPPHHPNSEYYEVPSQHKPGRSGNREHDTEKYSDTENECLVREALELDQVIANHTKRLQEDQKKLRHLDSEITAVTREEEQKWSDLYDCRDEITKALQTVHRLDGELECCDEVLLSEELNVLLRKQEDMKREMSDVQKRLTESDKAYTSKKDQLTRLEAELNDLDTETQQIDSEISENEKTLNKLQVSVTEKKKFLTEAENGYISACDDLKEAELLLEKRRQMLIELERELREYNLKSFISTGFSEKLTPAETT